MQKCFRSLLGEAQNVMEMDAVFERGFSENIWQIFAYAKFRDILLCSKCSRTIGYFIIGALLI